MATFNFSIDDDGLPSSLMAGEGLAIKRLPTGAYVAIVPVSLASGTRYARITVADSDIASSDLAAGVQFAQAVYAAALAKMEAGDIR